MSRSAHCDESLRGPGFLGEGASLASLFTARRILVLGSSGSGKTTLTRRLASALELEPIHLDQHFWQPGWVSTPQAQWRELVAGLIQRPSWIMDGTYESTLDLRLPAAEAAIVLDRSRLVCLWQVLKRKLTVDDSNRPDAPAGQKVDRAFLRYIWNYPAVTHPFVLRCLAQYGSHLKLVCLAGNWQIEQCCRAAGEWRDRSDSSLARRTMRLE